MPALVGEELLQMKKKGNVTGYNIILLIVLSRKFKYEVWLHTATSYIVLDVEHG